MQINLERCLAVGSRRLAGVMRELVRTVRGDGDEVLEYIGKLALDFYDDELIFASVIL